VGCSTSPAQVYSTSRSIQTSIATGLSRAHVALAVIARAKRKVGQKPTADRPGGQSRMSILRSGALSSFQLRQRAGD